MRVLLHTGVGGAGRTTLAAATAVHAAGQGVRALLVSLDPAHGLADVLDVPLAPGEPRALAAGLTAVQLDAGPDPLLAALTARPDLGGAGDGGDGGTGPDDVPAAPLALLLALADLLAAAPDALVVVDAGPVPHAVALAAAAETTTRLVDRLLPRALGLPADATTAEDALGDLDAAGDPPLAAALTTLRARATSVAPLLAGSATTVRLVTGPGRVAAAATGRARTALALHGCRVEAVLLDRGHADAPGATDAAHAADPAVPRRPGPRVLAVPAAPTEPVGLAALSALGAVLAGALGAAVDGPASARPDPATPAPVRVEPADGGYRLVLDLGLDPGADVALVRRGDELDVMVPGARRSLPLPSVLRRCTTHGARVLAGGTLAVAFRPDPALWPAQVPA